MGIIETIKMLTREEGLEKRAEQKIVKVVKKLLLADKCTEAEIANFASVTEEFVAKVKKD